MADTTAVARMVECLVTRGPDGQWLEARGPAIRDLTFAELQRYDVGRIKPGTKYAMLAEARFCSHDGARK